MACRHIMLSHNLITAKVSKIERARATVGGTVLQFYCHYVKTTRTKNPLSLQRSIHFHSQLPHLQTRLEEPLSQSVIVAQFLINFHQMFIGRIHLKCSKLDMRTGQNGHPALIANLTSHHCRWSTSKGFEYRQVFDLPNVREFGQGWVRGEKSCTVDVRVQSAVPSATWKPLGWDGDWQSRGSYLRVVREVGDNRPDALS